jgi:Leucine-rich repeat (LRR) protein
MERQGSAGVESGPRRVGLGTALPWEGRRVHPPGVWFRPWVVAMLLAAGCRCDDAASTTETGDAAAPAPTPDLGTAALPAPRRLVVSHPAELAELDLTALESLDLALAESDRLGRLTEIDATTACLELDLSAIVARAPALVELRLSGCSAATTQLAVLDSVRSLTLTELELGVAGIAQLGELRSLERLTFTRVKVPEKVSLAPLAAMPLREIAMVDLDRNTPLADALELWPTTLVRATLAGSWASHDPMTHLSKATALERLELRDTRVLNFSLNQIKPLVKLRELVWIGDNFNDNSPLYFRDLGVTSFTCDCPRFTDAGLHTMRHNESVERLALPRSSISGPGLAALAKLPALRELVLVDRDLGQEGFEILQTIPTLRRLDLSGTAAQPAFPGLGALVQLEQLRLHYPELDDRAAVELGRLVALRDLDLAGTRISDVGLAHLAALSRLRVLILSGTRITNRGLSALSGLKSLTQLHLDHTDVVDAGVAHLAPLVALETLRLDHTLVTDASIDHLLGLVALRRLDVTGTVITPEGIARLGTLPNLVELVHGDASAP